MLSERLQLLVTPAQRRRLDEESRRRGTSVGAVVREAIDARYGSATPDDRRRAYEAIERLQGTFLPPAEIEAIVDEERDGASRLSAPQ
jgi:hypothetical protein